MQLFFFTSILLSCVPTVTAWAGCHGDRDMDHRRRENCTALGFSDVPAGFEPTTKVLLFPSNLFSRLAWSSFQIFEDIYEIDLTANKVPEVSPSGTAILPSLSVLRLGSNRLKSLSDGSFSACPALTKLYLDNNAVDSLSGHAFSGLHQLEILDLSSNRISVLPELMLRPLVAIETLYLENNKIKVMPDDWFSEKEDLQYLYLSANPWACSCSLGYLHRYLKENQLSFYVRDGLDISGDINSVVCDSPPWFQHKPVMTLEESDLCSPATQRSPTTPPFHTDTAADTIPNTPPPTTTTTVPTTLIPATTTLIPTTTTLIPTTTTLIPTTTTLILTTTTLIPTTSTLIPAAATSVEVHTKYHRVVTWYQTFTQSEVRGDVLTPRPTVGLTNTPPTSTATSPTLGVVTTTAAAEANITLPPSFDGAAEMSIGAAGAGVFCFWLFAGCLLLCVASAACVLATLARLVVWYRRVYRPLSAALARRGGGSEAVRLLRREQREVAGGGGVMALYRSVLYIHRDGEGVTAREDGGEESEGGGATAREDGGEESEGGGAMKEEAKGGRGMYRKTLFRLLSKEEEIDGWRDVMEECRVSAVGGGGGRRRGGGVSRKCYSVILREEREEAGGGREELDWVVGGWEVKRGEEGEEPRSSWGEWLARYLPSMPWGVTTPPEAAQ